MGSALSAGSRNVTRNREHLIPKVAIVSFPLICSVLRIRTLIKLPSPTDMGIFNKPLSNLCHAKCWTNSILWSFCQWRN